MDHRSGPKASAPPPAYYGPPPAAPPSYSQAVGGVPPSSPYQPQFAGVKSGPTTIVTTVVPVGPNATHMICPHCHHEIETNTVKTPSLIAWLSGAIIALLGFWCGCCFIPCCIDSCMDVQHTCPNCNAFLGQFKR